MKKPKQIWKIGKFVKGKGHEILSPSGKRIGWADPKKGLFILDECIEIWSMKS